MTQKLIGNCPRGLLFIVSAPSGTGKTTLIDKLTRAFPNVVRAVTTTTRPPRPGEQEGIDYHFLSQEDFDAKTAAGEWLEHVTLYGKSYGSSRQAVDTLLSEGKHVVLSIDTKGVRTIRPSVKGCYIFIAPPSMEALRERLKKRGTEDEEALRVRLEWAQSELDATSLYDYLVVNDDLDLAYEVLRSIIVAEERRQKSYR